MSHPWDDIPRGGGAYFKFESPGDSVKGTVTRIGKGTTFSGDPCPEFDLETDDGIVTVSAGQAQLKRLILEALPSIGDTVVIVYTHNEKTAQGGEMKCFDVACKAGDGAAPASNEPALAGKPATSAADLL